MTTTLAQATYRAKDNRYEFGKPYFLFLKAAKAGQISVSPWIAGKKDVGEETIYEDLHGFLTDWQEVTSLGYAKTAKDLAELFAEILIG